MEIVIGFLALGVLPLPALAARARALRGRAPTRELTVHEVAYLAGGERRVIGAVLTTLRGEGAIWPSGGGGVRATTRHHEPSSHLEAVVYRAIQEGGTLPTRGPYGPPVREALDALRDGLSEQGLAPDATARRRARLLTVPFWLVPLVPYLLLHDSIVTRLVLPPATLLLGAYLLFFPHVTRAGRKALATAEDDYRYMHPPGRAPEWASYGVSGATIGVALYGAEAMMSFDPSFAHGADLGGALATGPGSFARALSRGVNQALDHRGGGAGGCGGGDDGGGGD
ncbi:TIGR04222 domain-containing membrane protein [Spirillospora sp. CA-294931]|uniref:TIGR04222 domain-containing membrane protein n=1 Tax=Spirillospora sp. CA-294931 TaxID=3240042 RepID=UPI003D8CAE74